NSWDAPGHIWYAALQASIQTTGFQEFADTTYAKAGELYGAASNQQKAVLAAWGEVGIRISHAPVDPGPQGDTLAALQRQVAALSAQVTALAKDVAELKARH